MIRTLIMFLSLALLILTTPISSSFAEEEGTPAVEEDVSAEGEKEVSFPRNPHLEPLLIHAKALVDSLEEDELKVIYDIRNSFGVTRSIRVVHDDVKKAVRLCGEKNTDLKDDVNNRFDKWEKAVMEAVEKTEKRMKTAIDKQTVRPAGDINEYLRLTKQAADFSEEQIDKRPVTTESACKGLLKSMDNTQDVLIGLLDEIKIKDLEEKKAIEVELEAGVEE